MKEGRKVVMPRPERETLSGTEAFDEEQEKLSPTVPYEGSTLPFIVIIVEELADLMMTVQAEV